MRYLSLCLSLEIAAFPYKVLVDLGVSRSVTVKSYISRPV